MSDVLEARAATVPSIDARVASLEVSGPPPLTKFAHVSLPTLNLEEGVAFYTKVLGGKLMFQVPTYAAIDIAGIQFGLGTDGCSFVQPHMEYPHIAFYVTADEMLHMRKWLSMCGVPMTNLWTRKGEEALMFFRDPSSNLIELLCRSGIPDADKLPRGDARGGAAIEIENIYYTEWKVPGSKG
jgi:catechol 2,3-dioxygenase-like lactoylglutathione lyase family enzyme